MYPKMTNRLKRITSFLISFNKDFKIETWENCEGKDIIVDDIKIAVPDDFEKIIKFEAKNEILSCPKGQSI